MTQAEFLGGLPQKPSAGDIRAAIDRARSAPVPVAKSNTVLNLPITREAPAAANVQALGHVSGLRQAAPDIPRSKWSVFRERQRRGQIVLNVVVDEHQLAATVVAAGYLSEREALDRRRLEAATALIVKDWCEWWRSRTR